jgi:TetR/AcrR family transcriptional regulator, regulator of autoinduction and epiphytic fitness
LTGLADPDEGLDPRIERSRRVVKRAALEELAAAGYGAFSIESVAKRSGVAKSTIYRHWPGKLALVADALETLNVQPVAHDLTAPASPRQRVEQLIHHLASAFRDSTLSGCTPALIEAAEHDPDVRAFHHGYSARRRRSLVDAIAAGVAAGDFPAHLDPDVASLALAGAIIYRRVMTGQPFDPADTPRLVETVLGPRPSGS